MAGTRPIKILFFGADNVGPSAVAEALARRAAAGRALVFSAGIEPGDAVDPVLAAAVEKAGADLSAHRPRGIRELGILPFDVVVTVDGDALEKIRCAGCWEKDASGRSSDSDASAPIFFGAPIHIHWTLAAREIGDPTARVGETARHVEALFDHGYLPALAAQRRTTADILGSLDDGLILHDEQRRIYLFNEAAERITGHRRVDVLGKDCHDVLPPDGLCGSLCPYADKPPENPGDKDAEITFTTPRGEEKRLQVRTWHLEADGGAPRGVLAMIRDVTEVSHLRFELRETRSFHGMVGVSSAMREVVQMIRQVTASDYPVLITGESGTGKELVAHAIHNESRRQGGPFVPINCGALPEQILESELFGHVRGAFTGAIRDKKGRFELADKGTLFLDEVGELSPAFQVKLLRVLQEKRFELVGSEKTVHVDVRVISATNRNLLEMVRAGGFREDLYYRLCVVPIDIPPLRERREDVALLADHALSMVRKETGKEIVGIADEAMERMLAYDWPGNVRELINALRFAGIRCDGPRVLVRHLPPEVRGDDRAVSSSTVRPSPAVADAGSPKRRGKLTAEAVDRALVQARGNKVRAAKILGVGRATLYRFLKDRSVSR